MLFILSFQSVIDITFASTHGLSISTIFDIQHQDFIVDGLYCGQAIYIIASNGSLLGKGDHKVLFNHSSQLYFTYIFIDNVKQLFCAEGYLWYINSAGLLYKEERTGPKQMKFTLEDNGDKIIKQLIGDSADGQFHVIYTTTGLFFKGSCKEETQLCAQLPAQVYSSYTQLNVEPIQFQDIKYIELEQTNSFIFIHTKNNEVFALGKNENGILPVVVEPPLQPYPDTSYLRKIGTGLRRVSIGWDVSVTQPATFYLRNGSVYSFNRNQSTPEKLVQSGVYDFQYNYGDVSTSSKLYVKNQSVDVIIEQKSSLYSMVESYCFMNPTNQLCANTSNPKQECYDASGAVLLANDFCRVYECETNALLTSLVCDVTGCIGAQSTNSTCVVLNCKIEKQQYNESYNQQCHFNYQQYKYTASLLNALDFIFVNCLLIQYQKTPITPPPDPVTPEPVTPKTMQLWIAVGIAAGSCIIILTPILIVSLCMFKKHQQQSQTSKISIDAVMKTPLLNNSEVKNSSESIITKNMSIKDFRFVKSNNIPKPLKSQSHSVQRDK
ncbi:Regulator_of chromosome condensation 1/beta-lactamase-inhibitor protein II [Hexamita inflata]|uniref:Regulator of chromosome condensation 1/beta-lactamase-inhibitor protein II n=1 Tax=Hexamita inflata TaxID=28002 RepID=A0AA86UR79_9EUKA|nr:Regulator of chromosome condensation 1/beta-lactamase-inhibitor protein II [Hexamita inflata]